jgi:hypothetical protein
MSLAKESEDLADLVEIRILAEGAEEMADLVESLVHPKHAAALMPQRASLRRILISRWMRQKAELLRKLEPFLRKQATAVQEADAALLARLLSSVTSKITATAVFDGDTAHRDEAAYDSIISETMAAGVTRMELDYLIKVAADVGQKAIASYLEERSLSKLAADIDATSKDEIARALASTFESGGTYQDAVAAIKDTVDGFSDYRADMIARTELNATYNSAMLSSAKEVSGAMKEWSPDGEACPEICMPNVEQGRIPVDDDFDSGDDAPPAHPNCDCSLNYIFPRSAE